MIPLATLLFLVSMGLTTIPLFTLAWYLYRNWKPGKEDVALLGRTILFITICQLFFYLAQFTSVFLGSVLGVGMQARIPIIFMIDGSLVLITLSYWYTLHIVRKIHRNGK